MTIKKITYKNFRNIEDATLGLHPEMNLLYGANAQGKTNALEAICLLASGRSYRTAKEREFIKDGEDHAEIYAEIETKRRPYTLQMSFYKAGGNASPKKKCLVNGIPVRKMSDFISVLRVVTFFPEHLSIVREGPAVRRGFLDSAISQLDRDYLRSLQAYAVILEQRNFLLQSYFTKRDIFDSTIGLWNAQMASLWAKIAERREKYLRALESAAGEAVREMSGGKEQLTFSYKKPLSPEEYKKILSENTEREAVAGSTQYGAHREDFEIRLNGKPAKAYASQGQCRSIAIGLKVGEADLSSRSFGEEPVILLDDVLSELDEGRRRYLLCRFPGLGGDGSGSAMQNGRQVIITGCESLPWEKDEQKGENMTHGKRFFVEAGKYTEI